MYRHVSNGSPAIVNHLDILRLQVIVVRHTLSQPNPNHKDVPGQLQILTVLLLTQLDSLHSLQLSLGQIDSVNILHLPLKLNTLVSRINRIPTALSRSQHRLQLLNEPPNRIVRVM